MTRKFGILMVGLLSAGTMCFTVGCKGEEGPAEKAGEKLDEAADKAGDVAEEAADKAEDAMDDLEEKVDDAGH